jgi:hypothetical protein
MTRTGGIDVHATSSGAPLPGVLVQVRNGTSTPATAGDVVWTGVTGPDGHARATIRTERVTSANLEVTLDKAGYLGTWTDMVARASLGRFAPSARVASTLADLGNLDLDLERSP